MQDTELFDTVLFLCTGNYYRSRYAEHYFNAQARLKNLPWQASSRGLQPSLENLGFMSRDALTRLRSQGIEPAEPLRYPQDLCEEDLAAASLIVAVKEAEHRPMMEACFPDWAERVRYWTIHDLDVADAASGLGALEEAVQKLLGELSEP